MGHRPPLRQEDVLDRPVEAAGPAQPGHVAAPLDDLRFRTREDPTPVDQGAVWVPRGWPRRDLEAPSIQELFLTTAAKAPATADAVATSDRTAGPPPGTAVPAMTVSAPCA